MAARTMSGSRMDHCIFVFNQGNKERWKSYIFHGSLSVRDINCFVGNEKHENMFLFATELI